MGYRHLSKISEYHLLHQKEVILPFRTLKLILGHKRLLESRTPFQKDETLVEFRGFECHEPKWGSYFERNIIYKGPRCRINNLHHRLTNNAILNILKSKTPNPPFVLAYTLVPKESSEKFCWSHQDPPQESAS